MRKKDKHIFFVEETNSSSVLIIGFAGILKEVLFHYLKEYDYSIFQKRDDIRDSNLAYIFQKDNLNQLTRNLIFANKHKAKFILLVSAENPKISAKIKESFYQIRGDIEAYFFSYPEPHNRDEAESMIKEIFSRIFTSQKSSPAFNNQESGQKKPATFSRTRLVFKPSIFFLTVFFVSIISFLIYSASILLPFYFGLKTINRATQDFYSSFTHSKKMADQAYGLFSFASHLLDFSLPVFKKVNYRETKAVEEGFETLLLLSKTLSQVAFTAASAQNISEAVISSRTALNQTQLNDFRTELMDIDKNISLLIANIRSMHTDNPQIYRYLKISQRLKDGEKTLKEAKELVLLADKFTQVLPEMLGYDKPKTFLLLFQNNSELRPTGGFIGSFGWLTFSNGRLTDFKIEDVYTADGQLKGHVPPPEPIKKFLNQENWYLRDSNFDPDFLTSANQAEWFLKHEMNFPSFDGVFAFDLDSVQGILRGLGGVYLTDYSEMITADNLFLKAQAASEIGFFPGSTQKKDFLGSLGRAIFVKLTTTKVNWGRLIKEIKNSLDNKHLLLYFHNDYAQELIEEAGWGGRIASVFCREEGCIADYLMIVEANFGFNKANFLVQRNANLNIALISNELLHELTIDYTNESPASVYPGGSYFSYTRILLPERVEIKEIYVAGEKVKNEDLTFERYQDKASLGFPFKLDFRESKRVRMVYSLPFGRSGPVNLELLVQKQPGINPFNLDIALASGKTVNNQSLLVTSDHLLSFTLNN